jgi:regulator of protease activity HflC (stomatin/prohibitin superfamily)
MPSLDLGQPVSFDSWSSQADRLARVKYRDAHWDARIFGECVGQPGEILHITGIQGSVLARIQSTAGGKLMPSPVSQKKSLKITRGESSPEHTKEASMGPKLIVALILSIIVFTIEPTRAFAIPFAILAFAIVFVIEGVRIVPQQNAWVVERLGRYHETLEPGLRIIVPFVDRVAYKHSLKEVPFDVPEQVCITKDNTQLAVDGLVYYQVTDPRLASYGTSDYIMAITQLAQTMLRSEVGKMELDKTLESREEINKRIVAVLDEAGRAWGVKVLRYEVKNLTPPESILRAMQQQITAEREKRALIAKSEGQKQEEINLAEGMKQSAILKSEGEKTAAINGAQGEARRFSS